VTAPDAIPPGSLPATARALLDTVASFWPEAQVRIGRSRPGEADVAFPVVPDLRRPRMLLPAARGPATGSLLRFSTALGARETATRLATAAVARTLGPRALGADQVVVRGGGDSLAGHLADLLGDPVSFSVTIGTARANRKPILQVFAPDGRCVAFAKVGDTAVASGHVLGEADALRRIEGRLGEEFEVPRVLSLTTWRGQTVLLITPLATRPQDPRHAGRAPVAEMQSFTEAFAEGSAALPEVPQWAGLRATVDGLADRALAGEFGAGLDRIEALAAGAELPVGAWHGDWTAWNMARRPGVLQLWDFERFATGVLSGLDPFHYTLNHAVRAAGLGVDVALAGAREGLRQVGDTPRQRLLGAVHLAAVGLRYAGQAEQPGGQVALPRARVIAEALRAWLP
jgi:hypothetical protein